MRKDKKPVNTIELQKILANKFETTGLTGKISLQGSERKPDKTSVAKPFCESANNCKWVKVD